MAGDELDGFALIDWVRSACLCGVGLAGHSVAVAVTDDGRDTLWIVDEAELHAADPRHGNGAQAHEQLGRLPASFRPKRRVRPAPKATDERVLHEIVAMRQNGCTFGGIAYRLNINAYHLDHDGWAWARRPGNKRWYPQLVRSRYLGATKRAASS